MSQKQLTPPERGQRALTGSPLGAMIGLRSSIGCDLTTNYSRLQLADDRGRVTAARSIDSGYCGIESETAKRAVHGIARDSNKMLWPMHVGTESHPLDPRRSQPFTGMLCLDHRTKSHTRRKQHETV